MTRVISTKIRCHKYLETDPSEALDIPLETVEVLGAGGREPPQRGMHAA
jgi:hypothetical protein